MSLAFGSVNDVETRGATFREDAGDLKKAAWGITRVLEDRRTRGNETSQQDTTTLVNSHHHRPQEMPLVVHDHSGIPGGNQLRGMV